MPCWFIPLLLALAASPQAAAAEQRLRVTTDSKEYCHSLAARFASLPAAQREPVQELGEEGERLCDTEQVRVGIAKLRRALRTAYEAN